VDLGNDSVQHPNGSQGALLFNLTGSGISYTFGSSNAPAGQTFSFHTGSFTPTGGGFGTFTDEIARDGSGSTLCGSNLTFTLTGTGLGLSDNVAPLGDIYFASESPGVMEIRVVSARRSIPRPAQSQAQDCSPTSRSDCSDLARLDGSGCGRRRKPGLLS
jgi:hypothetical protein